MAAKREEPVEESDQLVIRPLGAGQEVGRSCIVLEYKGKKIMLDCGIHPGLIGLEALPYTDLIDPEELDLLIISHFHLDHCGALPWFLEKTAFRGRCFMTHPTKAIYRWLLSDYVKVSNISTEHLLYTESDIEKTMDKIETLDFHQEMEFNGIRFWCYHAGHVLGAAMFMIEIAGVKILYTGDFSCQEDRHLMAAEVPNIKPDVLICESTYGTHIHEPREQREGRFTHLVHDIVHRGGRCLIPVFALGRAQELLLILDEYWGLHPELHDVPIYYASSLAKRCMTVYQTYVNAMNDRIRSTIGSHNPFQFRHISNLKSMDHFEDIGPSVVMASPGMMQSGLSRELFEAWCTDPRNGCIIAGYCVEGTLAKHVLSNPDEVMSINGGRIPVKCTIDYISFSAHTDYQQTSNFIRSLKPTHIVLVHGEANEMARLKAALTREYEDDPSYDINIHNPRNTQTVDLQFRGEKMAKVVGRLANNKCNHGDRVSGLLVKRNFNYHIMAPEDLQGYADLSTSSVTQKVGISFSGTSQQLHYYLNQLSDDTERLESKNSFRVFKCIDIQLEPYLVTLEWISNPINDMFADTVTAVVLKADQETAPQRIPPPAKVDKSHYRECLLEMLTDMFGANCVNPMIRGNKLTLTVEKKEVIVDTSTLEVKCADEDLQSVIHTAVSKLYQAINPIKV